MKTIKINQMIPNVGKFAINGSLWKTTGPVVNVLEYSGKVQVLIECSDLSLGTARRFDVFQVFRFGCCTLPKTHMEPEIFT